MFLFVCLFAFEPSSPSSDQIFLVSFLASAYVAVLSCMCCKFCRPNLDLYDRPYSFAWLTSGLAFLS